jgi:hypothetical protein
LVSLLIFVSLFIVEVGLFFVSFASLANTCESQHGFRVGVTLTQ